MNAILKRGMRKKIDWKIFLHKTFRLGIALKGLDGVFQIIGAALLFFIKPAQINQLIILLTRHELSEDPKDLIANNLIKAAGSLSVADELFGAFYLLVHGIIKIILVTSLWKRRLWAYPVAIAFFIIFILYQIYRYSYDHALWLILLTIFDIIVVFLTAIEYKHLKKEKLGRP